MIPDQNLIENCEFVLGSESSFEETFRSELNDGLIKYGLSSSSRNKEGRFQFNLFWNAQNAHLLPRNFNLSKSILKSLTRKLDYDKLLKIDEVMKSQMNLGIIRKIDNVNAFLHEHSESSFLPFMGIFRPHKQTTKVRIVFLSNLCEKTKGLKLPLSHNNTIWPGPNLNSKLSTCLLHLRFDKYLLCFDIVKAFNQI